MIRRSMFATKRLSPGEVEIGRLLLPVVEERPRTRGECESAPRPCPWVGCRHHLLTEVNPSTGTLTLTHLPQEGEDWADVLERMPLTCALDGASSEEGMTLDEVGAALDLTKERIRQVEDKVTLALRKLAPAEGELPDLKVLLSRVKFRSKVQNTNALMLASCRERLIRFLRETPGPYVFSQLIAAGGYGQSGSNVIAQFRKKGLIVKTGVNQYDRGEVERLQGPAVLALAVVHGE